MTFFPPVDTADENGLLAFGGDLDVDSLLLAYTQGIFPWPIGPQYPLAWFTPDPRGILRVKNLHISRSLQKCLRQYPWQIKFNTCFAQVIHACAMSANRKKQQGTWINNDIIEAYIRLFRAQFAFSTEVFLEGELVGGLYGVSIGDYVAGESMYFSHDNASKVALAATLDFLNQRNIQWIDTQMITPVVKQLGGEEISRKEFLKLLGQSLATGISRTVFHRYCDHQPQIFANGWDWPRIQS